MVTTLASPHAAAPAASVTPMAAGSAILMGAGARLGLVLIALVIVWTAIALALV